MGAVRVRGQAYLPSSLFARRSRRRSADIRPASYQGGFVTHMGSDRDAQRLGLYLWVRRPGYRYTGTDVDCQYSSSNKMPAAVRAALQQVLVSQGGKTEEDAKDYIVRMEREGRLTEECWS